MSGVPQKTRENLDSPKHQAEALNIFMKWSTLVLSLPSADRVWFVCADVPGVEQPELFLKKLQQCCTVFDFMDTLSDLKMKEYKRSTLNELVDYVTVSRGYLTEQAYPEVVKMVSGGSTCPQPQLNTFMIFRSILNVFKLHTNQFVKPLTPAFAALAFGTQKVH